MSEFQITLETDPRSDDLRIVRDGVVAFNLAQAGEKPARPVALLLRDDRGAIVGGLAGALWAKWLHVETLWIAEPLRGRGYGRRLLADAEAYARSEGCAQAFLEVFDFQALAFYQRLGYDVFGALDGFPAGHRLCYLRKALIEPVSTL